MNKRMIDTHMKVAETYANLSYAIRLKVGAIVVKDNRVISIGYNGTPSGWSNQCEEYDFVKDGPEVDYTEMVKDGYTFGVDKEVSGYVKSKTKAEVIHAEANAIAKLARTNESGLDSEMFITHAPCIECAKLIFAAGIKSVYFKNFYRESNGLEFLEKCNVKVERV